MKLPPSIIFLLAVWIFSGCMTIQMPELGELYSEAAQNHGPERNPVIVIPGILGSRLVDTGAEVVLWGAFGSGSVSPNSTFADNILYQLLLRPE